MPVILQKIVSGGQTGADRAALDVAVSYGFPHGGWVPEGRIAEDGVVPLSYNLKELMGKGYAERTKMNVIDSDGTLIISHGPLNGGSALTYDYAIEHNKPCLHLDMDLMSTDVACDKTLMWLSDKGINVLNVAGPRESNDPEIYPEVRTVLLEVLRQIGGRF